MVFTDNSSTEKVEIEYPLGHWRRCEEGIPVLDARFRCNLTARFSANRCDGIIDLCKNQQQLESSPVNEFMDKFLIRPCLGSCFDVQ